MSVAALLQFAAKEHERDPIASVVVDSSRLVKACALRQSADASESSFRRNLDHRETAALLAEPSARGVDELRRKAASARDRVDGDEVNAPRTARSRGFAEHDETDKRARIAGDDRLVLIGRSRQRALEYREERFGVWRIAERRRDERSGGRGIRRGEGTKSGRH